MASRRKKRKPGSRDFVKTFLFLLVLIIGSAAGYLYHSNRQLKTNVRDMQKETSSLKTEVKKLKSEIQKKDNELAELKIQAVIKDSEAR